MLYISHQCALTPYEREDLGSEITSIACLKLKSEREMHSTSQAHMQTIKYTLLIILTGCQIHRRQIRNQSLKHTLLMQLGLYQNILILFQ